MLKTTAHAQDASSQVRLPGARPQSNSTIGQSTYGIKIPYLDQSETHVELSYMSSNYLRARAEDELSDSRIELNYQGAYLWGKNKIKTHVLGGIYLGTDFSYVSFPQLSYARDYTFSSKIKLTSVIGREYFSLSTIDDRFNLGLIEPYFSQDQIAFQKQGLIGLHSNLMASQFNLGFNFYPVAVPNQGPSVVEKNGKLVGANRWVSKAPDTYIYDGQTKNIDYTINPYNPWDLVNFPGYSLTTQFGRLNDQAYQFTLGYYNTPLNDVVISRNTYADLDMNGSVLINAVRRYSDKYIADVQYGTEKLKFFISYIHDSPRNKTESNDMAVQFLDPLDGYSAGLDWQLTDLLGRTAKAGVSYAQFEGGEIRDMNTDGSLNTFTFAKQRLLFKKPARLNAEMEIIRINHNPLLFDMSWTYDMDQKGSLVSLKAKHQFIQNLTLSGGVDIFGVEDPNKDSTSFLTKHQADDRFSGAIQYVF